MSFLFGGDLDSNIESSNFTDYAGLWEKAEHIYNAMLNDPYVKSLEKEVAKLREERLDVDAQVIYQKTKIATLECENKRLKAEFTKIKRIADDRKHMNCDAWQRMFWYALANEIKNVLGTDSNVPANAPDTNDGRKKE